MIWASAPEGNFEWNITVPQRLKALVLGTPTARLKPCPSFELRFIHRGSAAPVVNSKESRMRFIFSANLERKFGYVLGYSQPTLWDSTAE
jgi:hypothetical protein